MKLAYATIDRVRRAGQILIWLITAFTTLIAINDLRQYFIEPQPTEYTLSIETTYKNVRGKEVAISASSIPNRTLAQRFYSTPKYHDTIDALLTKHYSPEQIGAAIRKKLAAQQVTIKEARHFRYRFDILWVILIPPITYTILDLLFEHVFLRFLGGHSTKKSPSPIRSMRS